jgi:hypothetical protein
LKFESEKKRKQKRITNINKIEKIVKRTEENSGKNQSVEKRTEKPIRML